MGLLRVRVRFEAVLFGRDESGLGSGSFVELDDVLLESGATCRSSGTEVGADEEQDDGDVEDDDDLEENKNKFQVQC